MRARAIVVAVMTLLSIAAVAQSGSRDEYANRLEGVFLKHGFDAYVTVEGPRKDTLRVRYILMSRPMVYRLMTEGTFQPAVRLGFRKLFLQSNTSMWQFYWDGSAWRNGRPPAEIAAERQKRQREMARERERQRKLDAMADAEAEERQRKEKEWMEQSCPDGTKRVRTGYGSYCAAVK